jgi:hypothetical protein
MPERGDRRCPPLRWPRPGPGHPERRTSGRNWSAGSICSEHCVGEAEAADCQVGDAPLHELLDQYGRQCAVSNQIVAASSLDASGRTRGTAPTI